MAGKHGASILKTSSSFGSSFTSRGGISFFATKLNSVLLSPLYSVLVSSASLSEYSASNSTAAGLFIRINPASSLNTFSSNFLSLKVDIIIEALNTDMIPNFSPFFSTA